MDSRPPGWLEPVLPVMPSRVLARPTLPPQGPFAPPALFVAGLVTTTVPSDSRCAALVFAGGLYEPRCPDSGRADGPLVFRSAPCPRAAPPTPPRPACAYVSGLGAHQTWPSPRHDRLGSRIVNLSRLQASLDVAARGLAPSVEALDTPLGPRELSPRAWGLLLGAPALTEAGLAPAGVERRDATARASASSRRTMEEIVAVPMTTSKLAPYLLSALATLSVFGACRSAAPSIRFAPAGTDAARLRSECTR